MSVDLAAVEPQQMEHVMARAMGDLAVLVNAPLKVLGRRLGLWRVLAGAGPQTSHAVAERTGLIERYVREWLFAQAAAGWLTYDEHDGTFTLDDASAAVIALEDSPAYFPLLTGDGAATTFFAAACETTLGDEHGVFRRDGDVWTISYRGVESHLSDSKGLRDLAVLLAAPGRAVHAFELYTGQPPRTGADHVLDDRAKADYRRRLSELETDLHQAEAEYDPYRASRIRAEHDALVDQLSAAVGLGGHDRRLGDERERARKAVTARIRDAIRRIARADPQLGQHLSEALQTGMWCSYAPSEPVHWHV